MTATSSSARLPVADWMAAAPVRAVVAALSAERQEVRFVGGCVRDTLAGRPVSDIDLATPDPPASVLQLLERARIKAVPTGLHHGTITAVVEDTPIEITTLREDVETFGRHARVAFTDDWRADAARRDFTFNALSASPQGQLFDYFGGLADLQAGRVRFVGDPAVRIKEDYLRILRFFRFQAHFGRVPPDPATLRVIAARVEKLDALSGERLRSELMKLLSAFDPRPALRAMAKCRVLDHLLPRGAGLGGLEALIVLEAPLDPLLRLAALLPQTSEAVEQTAQRLRLSNKERRRLLALAVPGLPVEAAWPAKRLREASYRLGAAEVAALLWLSAARQLAQGDKPDRAQLEQALALLESWQAPRFPLAGPDLTGRGLPPGPELGDLLRELEDWWIAADFAPDREACLARLDRLLSERGQNS